MADMTMLPTPKITDADRALANKIKAEVATSPKNAIWSHGFLGHTESAHVNVPDKKLLDNILFRGKKNGDTVFNDKKTEQDCLAETLTTKALHIARFVRTAKQGDTIVLYMPFFNDDDGSAKPIGHGFIGPRDKTGFGIDISKPIKAITSNMTATIIKKDALSDDGWRIVTSFPVSRLEPQMDEFEKSDLEITTIPDFDFAPILHATESYQHASPIQRALLDYNNIDRKTMAAVPVQYVPRRNGREEQIIVPMPQGRYAGESVIITGDERAAASRTGSFPLPTVIERITEHLMKKVNDQITQVEADRRTRKLAAARDMQDMKIMNPGDAETGPGTGNDEPGIT